MVNPSWWYIGEGGANGIEAWSRAHQMCSPSTVAAALTDMRVTTPSKVNHHRELIGKIEEWQVRVRALIAIMERTFPRK